MAIQIQRTHWQDDDGTGTTGTVLNDAEKQRLYDQIDEALATVDAGQVSRAPIYHADLPGGQIDDWNLGALGAHTFVVKPGGAGLTVTGIVAPALDGTVYLLTNAGGSPLTLAHYDSGSLAENRFFGPGNASYVLNAWYSVFVMYDRFYNAWLVLKA